MTEENVIVPANPTSTNTFTTNLPTSMSTYDMNWPIYTNTWPNYYTTGYLYAQISESQLDDLEARFRKVMRSELMHLLSQVLTTLEDTDEEDEDNDEEEDDED